MAEAPNPTLDAARQAAIRAGNKGQDGRRAAVEAVWGLHPSWPLPLVVEMAEAALYGGRKPWFGFGA